MMDLRPAASSLLTQVQVNSGTITTIFTASAQLRVELTRIFIVPLSTTPNIVFHYSASGGVPTSLNSILRVDSISEGVTLGSNSDSLGLVMEKGSTLSAAVTGTTPDVIVSVYGVTESVAQRG